MSISMGISGHGAVNHGYRKQHASAKPHLFDWIVRQHGQRKSILLQVFSGATFRECAQNLGISEEFVRDTATEAARTAPPCQEDDLLIALHACGNPSEFCRKMNVDRGIYTYLKLRYLSKEKEDNGCNQTVGYSAPAKNTRGGAAEARRQARLEARVGAQRERTGELPRSANQPKKSHAQLTRGQTVQQGTKGKSFQPQQEKRDWRVADSQQSQGTNRPHGRTDGPSRESNLSDVILLTCRRLAEDSSTSLEDAFLECQKSLRACQSERVESKTLTPDSLREMLKECPNIIWCDDNTFWFYELDNCRPSIIRHRVEDIAAVNKEYSARYFFLGLPELMEEYTIKSPSELYAILRVIYSEVGDGPEFGPNLSVCFGKANRRRQVDEFAGSRSSMQVEQIAAEYEKKYGFTIHDSEKWIRLSIARQEGVAQKAQGQHLAKDEDGHATADKSSEKAQPAWLVAIGTLGDLLQGPWCDISLAQERLESKFPGCPDISHDEYVLSSLGYFASDNLAFQIGIDPEEYFTKLIESHPAFEIGDSSFPGPISRNPTFRLALKRKLRSYAVLEYDKDAYISFDRLQSVTGISMLDVESYAANACDCVGYDVPFTIVSLRRRHSFKHPLEKLREEAQMPDHLFEGLLDASGLTQSCTIAGTRVFVRTMRSGYSAREFIEQLVAENEGIEREDLLYLLDSEFGIECSEQLLINNASNARVYYDDIGEAYYTSKSKWEMEARDALA